VQRLKTRNLFFEVLLSSIEIDRIIQMAWEDRTPFEAIKYQFNITEKEVIRLMKKEMTEKNWKKWRERVQGRKTKHLKLRERGMNRFKSSRQKNISGNRISKR
tara:strand:+ start:723 stop:1031 length:309 start_codon:yes stop_codon:yes gene_type:complete